jgi:hypothetical protein
VRLCLSISLSFICTNLRVLQRFVYDEAKTDAIGKAICGIKFSLGPVNFPLVNMHEPSRSSTVCLQWYRLSRSYFHSRRFGGGAPSREDPRRNKSSMRADSSAVFEKPFTLAARRSTGHVSLRRLLSHSDLGKEQHDGRHQGGHTNEERVSAYIYTHGSRKIDRPKRTFDPENFLAHGGVEE